MSVLLNARATLLSKCIAHTYPGGVDTVAFQPTPERISEDRHVVEEWDDIQGTSPWLFLAVLDGHGGTDAADYTANHLPQLIRNAVRNKIANTRPELFDPDSISALLRSGIQEFDDNLGKAVKELCPRPKKLTESQVQALIDGPNASVIRRAYYGTTLTAALIDGDKKHLWVVGLGDSSAVLSRMQHGIFRHGERLIKLHNTDTPSEYARVKLDHPSYEPNIMKNDRLLGGMSVTRAIGDFGFKLHSSFSKHLFIKFSSTFGEFSRHGIIHNNHSPPYVMAQSEVRYFDLPSLRKDKPILVLYTDGVNNIVNGRFLFRQQNPCTHDPAAVMGALLGDSVDRQFLRDVFDHEVELKWNGTGANRAVELLGNILAGKDADRLTQVLNPDLLALDDEKELYIDDTTIIVYPLA